MPSAPWAVFVDFDGTITDLDTFDVLVKHFAGNDAWEASGRGLEDGTVSLREVLQRQAAYVRGSFDEVATLLARRVRVDPTFASFVSACRRRGMPVTVVSSGIEPIIRLRLAEAGLVDLPVVANAIEPDPAGWRIRFRDAAGNGTDKAALVRAARARGLHTIFIGDGPSDYDAAVTADRRFARRGLPLERYLRERALPVVAFSSFDQIEPELAALPGR